MLIRLADGYWCDHSLISAVRKGLDGDNTISVCFFDGPNARIPGAQAEVDRIAKEVNAARLRDEK